MVRNTVEPGSSAPADANKDLVERYFDALERGALDEATGFWPTEATNHASGRKGQQPTRGREAIAMVHQMPAGSRKRT